MPGRKTPTWHIMKSLHSFHWILSWMLCSHPSRITSPPKASIILSLASCCAPSSLFQSMKKTQCEHWLLMQHHGLRAWPILQTNKVENVTIQLCAHDEWNWPSFLYPPSTEYNVNKLDKNLFHGPILIRVHSLPLALSNSQLKYIQTLQIIYMGKSSAFTGHCSAPKPSQAEMHGMHEVFPKAVTYAAVQVSYTITQSSPSHSIGFAGLLRPLLPWWLEHRGSVLQTQCFLRQVC